MPEDHEENTAAGGGQDNNSPGSNHASTRYG